MSIVKTREQAVKEFHEAAGNKTLAEGGTLLPHATVFAEELEEMGNAISDYLDNPTEENRANLVKEWADTVYTLSGLAWFFGFDGEGPFWIVAENNMTKVHPDGTIKRREDGKILKPDGYQKVTTEDMKGY